MINTLWTFGDSFTYGDGCVKNKGIRDGNFEYYEKYKQEHDDIWPIHLANKLELELKNLSRSGSSNDLIIDTIIKNYENIKMGDVVVIGKTFYERFDVPNNKTNDFKQIWGEVLNFLMNESESEYFNMYNELEKETILNYGILFNSHFLFKDRQQIRFNFIEKNLKNKTKNIIFWDVDSPLRKSIETISHHTKNKIKDYHFSFNGHKTLSNIFYEMISEKTKFI